MKKIFKKYSFRSAFTMLELVFVIVVIGILASIMVPNTKTNPVQEAAIQVASHIKYTQHLAMIDDRYSTSSLDENNNSAWFKERWQLSFTTSVAAGGAYAYTIFSDKINKDGKANKRAEIAKNPENSNQLMTGGTAGFTAGKYGDPNFEGMKKLNIGKNYGISSVGFSHCGGKRISFDHLGRPFKGKQDTMSDPYNSTAGTSRLIKTECKITLSDGSESAVISIAQETGYVSTEF